MRIHTIGHSTRTQGALIGLLTEAGVALLADVRSWPHSRRNPQFDAEVLEAALGQAGIGYAHLKALGGKRGPAKDAAPSPNAAWHEAGFRNYADYALTPAFQAGLAALCEAARARPTAIMCAEGHWSHCHRQIIADYLLAAGEEVVHILGPGASEPARLSPQAVPQPDGSVHYPAEQGSLF
jgi:uncharacterized protein (DUF488 family)